MTSTTAPRRTWRDHRGPADWPMVTALVLADIWDRMCAHHRRTGQPPPPDHLHPGRINRYSRPCSKR